MNTDKCVIFDFDGVIVDSFDAAYEAAREIRQATTVEEYKSLFDGNVFAMLQKAKFAGKFMANPDEFFEKARKHANKLKFFPEMTKEVKELANKYPLYIISSNLSEIITQIMTHEDLNDCFKEILCAEFHKSKEFKFKYLFKKYKKENCVFVTDTLGDLKEAHKVGLQNTIAVTWGFHEVERLKKGKPKILLNEQERLNETVYSLLER